MTSSFWIIVFFAITGIMLLWLVVFSIRLTFLLIFNPKKGLELANRVVNRAPRLAQWLTLNKYRAVAEVKAQKV